MSPRSLAVVNQQVYSNDPAESGQSWFLLHGAAWEPQEHVCDEQRSDSRSRTILVDSSPTRWGLKPLCCVALDRSPSWMDSITVSPLVVFFTESGQFEDKRSTADR